MAEMVLERPIEAVSAAQAVPITPASHAPEHYAGLLHLPSQDLRRHALCELRQEARLEADARRLAASARLRAWLELDDEEARVLGRVYSQAARSLRREDAAAWVEAERDAILHGLSFRQFTRLVELVPWLRSRLGLAVMRSALPGAGLEAA